MFHGYLWLPLSGVEVQHSMVEKRDPWPMTDPAGAGILLILYWGFCWWDPWHTIYGYINIYIWHKAPWIRKMGESKQSGQGWSRLRRTPHENFHIATALWHQFFSCSAIHIATHTVPLKSIESPPRTWPAWESLSTLGNFVHIQRRLSVEISVNGGFVVAGWKTCRCHSYQPHRLVDLLRAHWSHYSLFNISMK